MHAHCIPPPLSPRPQAFLSCGEDGEVMLFDLRARAHRTVSETGTGATTGDDLRVVHGPLASLLVTGAERRMVCVCGGGARGRVQGSGSGVGLCTG